MDKLEKYRNSIKILLEEFTKIKYANPEIVEIKNKTVFDTERDRYLVMSEGWERSGRRIHGCLVDIEIIQDKVWIQRDGTDYGIARDLMDAGIPKEEIVLGFKEPTVRPYTGFATA
jgi:XisI protein